MLKEHRKRLWQGQESSLGRRVQFQSSLSVRSPLYYLGARGGKTGSKSIRQTGRAHTHGSLNTHPPGQRRPQPSVNVKLQGLTDGCDLPLLPGLTVGLRASPASLFPGSEDGDGNPRSQAPVPASGLRPRGSHCPHMSVFSAVKWDDASLCGWEGHIRK